MTFTQQGHDASSGADAGIALLFGAFSNLCSQRELGGLLRALAECGRRFGTPWHIGCLLRDDATDAWYVTALLDPSGRPVDLARLGVPAGPFPFSPPEGLKMEPVNDLMGASWGEIVCRSAEQHLGVSVALSAPIRDSGGTRGVLLALTTPGELSPVLPGIVAHAAIAAAHHLGPAGGLSGNGVLAPDLLIQRAEAELARAQRYHRSVSVLTVLLPTESDLAPTAVQIARAIRSWDFIGRLEWNRPLAIDSAWPRFAVVLPETREPGVRGLIRRLKSSLPDCWFGFASFPEDGGSFMTLVERACHTATFAQSSPVAASARVAAGDPERSRRSLWRR